MSRKTKRKSSIENVERDPAGAVEKGLAEDPVQKRQRTDLTFIQKEEFDLEVEQKIKQIHRRAEEMCKKLEAGMRRQLVKLPAKVRSMKLSEFLGEHGGDTAKVLGAGFYKAAAELDHWIAETPAIHRTVKKDQERLPSLSLSTATTSSSSASSSALLPPMPPLHSTGYIPQTPLTRLTRSQAALVPMTGRAVRASTRNATMTSVSSSSFANPAPTPRLRSTRSTTIVPETPHHATAASSSGASSSVPLITPLPRTRRTRAAANNNATQHNTRSSKVDKMIEDDDDSVSLDRSARQALAEKVKAMNEMAKAATSQES